MKTLIAALIAISTIAAVTTAQAAPVNYPTSFDGPAFGPSDVKGFDGPAFGPNDIRSFDGPAFGPSDIRSFDGPARSWNVHNWTSGGNQR